MVSFVYDAAPTISPGIVVLYVGLDEIRKHLEDVDDVPLRVSSFFDSTPTSIKGMLDIMKEHGEKIGCVGSALNVDNFTSFSKADVSFSRANDAHRMSSLEEFAIFMGSLSADLVVYKFSPRMDKLIYEARKQMTNYKQALFMVTNFLGFEEILKFLGGTGASCFGVGTAAHNVDVFTDNSPPSYAFVAHPV